MKTFAFVTGAPRSGVTTLARILVALGASGGKDMRTDTYKFMNNAYEVEYFRNELINNCIRQQYGLPTFFGPTDPFIFSAIMKQFPEEELIDIGFIKDYRLIYLWKRLHTIFPRAIWIIAKRDFDDNLAALIDDHYMVAYHTKEQWADLLDQYENYVWDITGDGNDPYVRLLDISKAEENIEYFKPLCDDLGVKFDPDVIRRCLVR